MEDIKPTIIMIVDDQPDFVEGVKLILEVEGYEVWTASHGREALDQLERVAQKMGSRPGKAALPALILADIMMPIMDGYTLYEHTQASPALKTIPFIFLTAKTSPNDLAYGKELGVEDYLMKPCAPDVLLASVRGQLRNARLPADYYVDARPEKVTEKAEIEKTPEQVAGIGTTNMILIMVAFIGLVVTLITFGYL
jgi:CheY-like chemotaxis protein